MAEKVAEAITATNGRGVLWVLDGWDELPNDLPSDSIIRKLVPIDTRLLEMPVPESSVIITSRPSTSSDKLHKKVSTIIEILGFTQTELEQYFTECLNGNTQAVQTLLERIKENPAIEGSCYLPYYASIVVHVYMCRRNSFPKSVHEIFTAVVECSLKRYLMRKSIDEDEIEDIDITSDPRSLQSEFQAPFIQLCRMAYEGIKLNKLTFSKSELAAFYNSKEVFELGLLQRYSSIIDNGKFDYFCFLHLSVQELLAAIHISHMSPAGQVSVLKELHTDQAEGFKTVFWFYTGITKLQVRCKALSLMPRSLRSRPASLREFVQERIQIEKLESRYDYRRPKPVLVSLLHCLYETDDDDLCDFVAGCLGRKVDLRTMRLSPFDCLSVGYFKGWTAQI